MSPNDYVAVGGAATSATPLLLKDLSFDFAFDVAGGLGLGGNYVGRRRRRSLTSFLLFSDTHHPSASVMRVC